MLVQPGNGIPVVLSSILDAKDYIAPKEITFSSCGTDPQDHLLQGLFVCLSTEAQEAEYEISQAFHLGAVAVICRRGLKDSFHQTHNLDQTLNLELIFEVDNPEKVYGMACQALMDYPARKMKIIAVTGTSGKTSVSYVIAGMLAEAGNQVGLIGSLGTYDGKSLAANSETTPSPDRLAFLLDRMVKNKCTCAIIEISSIALEEQIPAGIIFDAICLTNIRRDHIERHGTLEQYRRIKMKIFDYVRKGTLVVCNLDDRVTEAILPLIKCPTITVGMNRTDCMVSGMAIEQDRSCQTFYLVAGIDAVPIRSSIIGNEHIYNCLLAAALGVSWDIDLKTIVRGIERVEHIPCRLERIDCGQPFAVFMDCCNTPETLSATLKTLRDVTTGKLYCVLGLPGDEERGNRSALGRTLEENADIAILTLGNQRGGPNDKELLDEIASGFEVQSSVVQFPRRKDALTWALAEAGPDDTILIVSSGAVSEGKARKEQASDRRFVRHWLYENQTCFEPFWY